MIDPNHVVHSRKTIDEGKLIVLQGDVDFHRSPELSVELMTALRDNVPRLVLDLAGVQYMDSSGVAVLVEALQTQRRRGDKLILCNVQPRVQGIFEISKLHKVFMIVPDVEAAATA